MEHYNFYAVIYEKDGVLRHRFISEDEYKNTLYFDNHGYFLIQIESEDFSAFEDVFEDAIQSLEILVKIIYRRYFLFNRYHDKENCLIVAIKEVENEYAEIQKQLTEEGTCL